MTQNLPPGRPSKRVIPPSAPVAEDDDLAIRESQALGNDRNVEKEAKERDHDRQQNLKDLLLFVIKLAIFIFSILLIVGIIIWGYHLVMPQDWRWLSKEDLGEIQKLMSSAVLAILVNDYAKKYF